MEINRKKSLVHNRCRGLVPNSFRKIRLDRQQITQQQPNKVLQSEFEVTHDEEPPISDSESSTTSGNSRKAQSFNMDGMDRLQEGEKGHEVIKNAFLSGMGAVAKQTSVVAIHKNSFRSLSGQAKMQTFQIYSEATNRKCGGNGNVKFGWYGTSKDGASRIVNYGFNQCGRPENNGLHGLGIYLSPHRFSLDGAISSPMDGNGIRHVLLCRVILGNMEEIHVGSEQTCPSSKDFDCGVDNMTSPRKYIVWGSHMNTHILPEYLISFKAPRCLNEMQEPHARPNSPWMPFPMLISVLSKFLSPSSLTLIQKHHTDYQGKKITRQQLIQHVRQVAGDKLLILVIKSFRGKQLKIPVGSPFSVNSIDSGADRSKSIF